MTTLTVTPDLLRKTARVSGRAAAGETVSVAVRGAASLVADGLRLRLLLGPDTVAVFPYDTETDQWETGEEDATCALVLDTDAIRAAFDGLPALATLPMLLVLDSPQADGSAAPPTLLCQAPLQLLNWQSAPDDGTPLVMARWRDRIRDLEDGLAAETAARQSGDSAEAIARQGADAALGSRIDSEASARQSGDAAALAEAKAYADNLAASHATEGYVDGKVQAEAALRQSADNALGGRIDSEAAARQGADNALQGQVNGKAPIAHGHAIADVTGLSAALDGKAGTQAVQVIVGNAFNNAKTIAHNELAALSTDVHSHLDDIDATLPTKADLEGGKVPSSQLPSYVDDVLEYDSLSAFPATGEAGKIYVAKDTGRTYRWTGTQYAPVGGDEAPIPYDSSPEMDGAASPGSSDAYARGDHRHPTDTSRVAKSGDTMTGDLNLYDDARLCVGPIDEVVGDKTYYGRAGVSDYPPESNIPNVIMFPRKSGTFALTSDIPAVVAPSTSSSDAGKAADAKATGDALAGKATSTHTHAQSDVSGLQAALNGKVSTTGATMTGPLEMQVAGHTKYYISDNAFLGNITNPYTNLRQAMERGDEYVTLAFVGTFYFEDYDDSTGEYVQHQAEVDTEVTIPTDGYPASIELDGTEFSVSLNGYDGAYCLDFYSQNAYFSLYFSDEYEAVENVRDKFGPVATEDDVATVAQQKIEEESSNILAQASSTAQSKVNTHNTAANAHSALFANLPFVDPTISVLVSKIPGWDGQTLYNRAYLIDDYSSAATQRTRTFKILTTSAAQGRITELMFYAYGNNVGKSSKIQLSLGDQSVVDLVDLSTLRSVGSNNRLIVYFKLLSIYDSLFVIERKKRFFTDLPNTPAVLEDF